MRIKLTLILLFITHISFAQDVLFTGNKTSILGSLYSKAQHGAIGLSALSDNINIVHIGLTAGMNFSNIVRTNSPYFTVALTGLDAGITFYIPIEFSMSFDAAILYSQKGYLSKTDAGNYNERLNFIDVPLLLKNGFGKSKKFNFMIGPQLSFLTSSNQTFDDKFIGNRDDYKYSRGKVFIGGVIGVSYDISADVDIKAKGAIDFNKTNTHNDLIPNYRNQVFQIGVGFKLD